MTEKKQTIIEIRKGLLKRLRKRKPYFRRYHWFKYALPDNWRKYRGMHNKQKRGEKGKPAVVKPGYRNPRIIRGLHPSGYEEVLVGSQRALAGIDPKIQAARLSSSLGAKKRKAITEKAREAGIKVLNA